MTRNATGFLRLNVRSVRTRQVYKLDVALSDSELDAVHRAFTDPVIEVSAVGRLPPPMFDWIIEVGFKPGVTDNLGRTAMIALQDVLSRRLAPGEAVYTGIQYLICGSLSREEANHLATDLLANTLIQSFTALTCSEWAESPVECRVPAIHESPAIEVNTVDLSGSDPDLMKISREGILSCSLEEMRAIRDYFNWPGTRSARDKLGLPKAPTDVEVECIAQSWSEHCKHKIFAGRIHYVDEQGNDEWIESLFKTYIRAATEKIRERIDWLVSVFTDNAGVIRFNERLNLVYKVETHNSPSALDPYGGAMTGIVGVNRDPMGTGLGSSLLCNVWGYCLGSPFYGGRLPEGLMHPRRIRDGVHQGVIEGGNQSGVPWARGWEIFDDRYIGKPLVYCGTVGVIPTTINGSPSEVKTIQPGDKIVMLGGRIGKDGIHGATFSSEELRQESPVQAVQIGDPITQRMMYEFLLEARDLGLYRCVTDNGAGGLSCSVGEMGHLSGGAELDLALAPLKYQGLKPWEILLSEAQERMTLAVAPGTMDAFLDLARRREVEATVLGTFTNSGVLLIRYGEKVVGRIDMEFLHEGCPVMSMEACWIPPSMTKPAPVPPGPRNAALRDLLAGLNQCSREFKSRQYDGEVKGLSVVKPYVGLFSDVPSDATVLRVEYGRNEGVILAEGINPFYSDIDTYHMMTSVIDEAIRKIISVGGRLESIAGLDNFCWPDPVLSEKTPDGKYKLAQLVRACRALYDTTTAFNVPCISGKDSCKNDSTRGGVKISIPPTVLFSTIGRIQDVRKAVTVGMKQPYDLIYVIGWTRNEMGASAYYRLLAEQQDAPRNYGELTPHLEVNLARALYRAMSEAHERGLLRSSHTPTRGGLALALALCAIGGDVGAEIDLSKVPAKGKLTEDELLFSESNSRFVVTISPEHTAALEELFSGLPCAMVGVVKEDRMLRIMGRKGEHIIETSVGELRKSFKEPLHGL